MLYGKFENSKLVYMRQPLCIDGKDVFTNDDAIIRSQGWKEVVLNEAPTDTGCYVTDELVESDTAITQVWTKHEIETSDDPYAIIDALTGEDGTDG